MSEKAASILSELVAIRLARRKFVSYDDDRQYKRREKELWTLAESLSEPEEDKPRRGRPPKAA
jgi:hypothetical protein